VSAPSEPIHSQDAGQALTTPQKRKPTRNR